MASQRVPWYNDWQIAADKSKQRKAVSEPFYASEIGVMGYSKENRKPTDYRLEIVKPLHGDPWFIYAKTGFKFVQAKCTARHCDRIKRWKSY